IRGAFLTALAAEAARVVTGNGMTDGTTMGPVVSQAQLNTDIAAVERAQAQGASIPTGGGTPDGLLFPPTILTDLDHDTDAAREEIFGPVITVLDAQDYDDGLAKINDSPYGLTAGICTNDLARAHHFAAHAQVGVVKVNRPTTGLDLNVPFGGVKDSSTNTFREQGPGAVEFYTWSKTVYLGTN